MCFDLCGSSARVQIGGRECLRLLQLCLKSVKFFLSVYRVSVQEENLLQLGAKIDLEIAADPAGDPRCFVLCLVDDAKCAFCAKFEHTEIVLRP